MENLRVFSGTANRSLAAEICCALDIPLGDALVDTFRNGETRIKICEHVRGADVFVVQSTAAPADHHLMELLLLIDALRRASAGRIAAVIPHYGYARQEKKTSGREPISAKLVANLITTAGAGRVVVVDLHTPAIQGFFDIPVDHLTAIPLLAARVAERESRAVVVSPDTGGVARANQFRHCLDGSELAIIAKYRPEPDVAEMVQLVGDVQDRTAVIVDDIIATGGTLIAATNLLLERGARRVIAAAVHGELAGEAARLIEESRLERVVVSNSVAVPMQSRGARIETVSIAPLLAEAIRRIHMGQSVSVLFDQPQTSRPAMLQPVG